MFTTTGRSEARSSAMKASGVIVGSGSTDTGAAAPELQAPTTSASATMAVTMRIIVCMVFGRRSCASVAVCGRMFSRWC